MIEARHTERRAVAEYRQKMEKRRQLLDERKEREMNEGIGVA